MPTSASGPPDREVLAAAYERVNTIAPSVLRFAALAVGRVEAGSRTASSGAWKPALDPDAVRHSSCAEILAQIEQVVFRLEQAMQLAELAADQAIASAARMKDFRSDRRPGDDIPVRP